MYPEQRDDEYDDSREEWKIERDDSTGSHYKALYRSDGSSVVDFGGPVGKRYYDKYGNEC